MDIITEYLNKINNIKIIESENKGDVIRFNRKFKNRGPYRTGSKIFAMVDKKGEYLGGLEYSESSISYVLNI